MVGLSAIILSIFFFKSLNSLNHYQETSDVFYKNHYYKCQLISCVRSTYVKKKYSKPPFETSLLK